LPPENIKFGGGHAETAIHPAVLVAMLIAVLLIFFLPRKYVIVPLLLCCFLAPMGQEIYVAGLHLLVSRILILAGCLRLLLGKFISKEPLLAWGFNSVDKAYTICILFQVIGVLFHFFQSQAIINQLAFLLDFLAAYFLMRGLLQNEEDIFRLAKCLAVITVVAAVGMVIEQMKMINIFGMLGGVRLVPEVREGKIRSQGVFQHPILAGTFAATLLPLFILLWRNGKSKLFAILGMVGATTMTITAQSSTPLLAYGAGFLAIFLWPLRNKLRTVRWGLVVAILCLQLVMKAPFWFVIAHIDLSGGSSGYHRAMLVDHFIRNFSDWWFLGTGDTSSWGDDMWDVQNQFVAVGTTGGLIALIAFIAVISRSFKRIGLSRKAIEGNNQQEWLFWFLGCVLFSSIVGFFGVNYFDQTRIFWFALLAMIVAVTAPCMQENPVLKKSERLSFRTSRQARSKETLVVSSKPADLPRGLNNRRLKFRYRENG